MKNTKKAITYIYIAGKKFKILEEGRKKYIQISLKYAKKLQEIHNVKTIKRIIEPTQEERRLTKEEADKKIIDSSITFLEMMSIYNKNLVESIKNKNFENFFKNCPVYMKNILQFFYNITNFMKEYNDYYDENFINSNLINIHGYLELIINCDVKNDNDINKEKASKCKKDFDKLGKGLLGALDIITQNIRHSRLIKQKKL